MTRILTLFIALSISFIACKNNEKTTVVTENEKKDTIPTKQEPQAISPPLITNIFTADPSAHVFDGKIYIYPSHDYDFGVKQDDLGSHFDMKDYHVLSMDSIGATVTDHGIALDIKDVAWAGRQMWAPDAAYANNKYYLYFPVKDKKDIFRIGVATSGSPTGPFKAEPQPIKGSYSIDPAVFKDDDGTYYMYFGGIWGGQLQRWMKGKYDTTGVEPRDESPALGAKVAKMTKDMLQFAEPVKEIKIIDSAGQAIQGKDNKRRFFEASWMHKYNGKYYFSYSTGDTHFLCYAIGTSPYGPFTYAGVILDPVIGWTSHHSIIEVGGKWYLFYHDSSLSGGKTHLRCVKVTELKYNGDGTIQRMVAYK
jgi:hypothetical protein